MKRKAEFFASAPEHIKRNGHDFGSNAVSSEHGDVEGLTHGPESWRRERRDQGVLRIPQTIQPGSTPWFFS
jgi:hypothetical protein